MADQSLPKKSSPKQRSRMAFRIWSAIRDHYPQLRWRNPVDQAFEPTASNFVTLIRKAEEALENEPDDTSYELGGVIVRKDAGHLDVFVYIGDLLEVDGT